MRPRDIEKLLETLVLCQMPDGRRKPSVMLLGSPGTGKTSIPLQIARKHKLWIVFFHPLFSEPIDLTGVPHVALNGHPDNAKTHWANPSWIPDDVPKGYNGIMVLVDEMSQCDPPMMKACAPIMEEHRIGTKILPNSGQYGTLVVATGNRAGDRAGAAKLLSHVKSRIMEVQFESSVEDFVEWGTRTNRIIPVVRYFVQFKTDLLNTFKPEAEGQYASQRGWEKASDLYGVLPENLLSESIAGIVGKGEAAEFLAYAKVWEELETKFNIDKILEKPDKAAIPQRDQLDIMHALTGSIAERAKAADGIKMLSQAIIYFNRMPKEFAFLGVQSSIRHVGKDRFQALCSNADYKKWFKENQELLNEARTQGN